MAKVFVSMAFWTFMLLSSLFLFPLALLLWLLTAPWDSRLVLLHRFTCFWGSLYTWVNPFWNVTILGRELIEPRQTYVMICNHQSLLDILVLFRLHVHYKWVSKKENFRIPLIGWNMSLNRYVRIDRGRLRGSLQMMKDAERALRSGNSICIFPEGTRSPDGRLGAFRDGAFELAVRTKTALLPMVLSGTDRALPKRGFILQGKQDIQLRILSPVSSEEVVRAGAGQLKSEARRMMESVLGDPHLQEPGRVNGS